MSEHMYDELKKIENPAGKQVSEIVEKKLNELWERCVKEEIEQGLRTRTYQDAVNITIARIRKYNREWNEWAETDTFPSCRDYFNKRAKMVLEGKDNKCLNEAIKYL